MPVYSAWSEVVSATTLAIPEARVTLFGVLVELEYIEPKEGAMTTYYPDNAGSRAMHARLPDEVVGYAFDQEFSWWAVVKAEPTVNLIGNPSFEGWIVGGVCPEYTFTGTWGESSFVQFPAVGATAGRRCVRLQTGVGTCYLTYAEPITVHAGSHTFAVDVYATRTPLQIGLEVVDGSDVKARRVFVLNETGWQRIHLTYGELATGQRTLRLTSPASNPVGVHLYTDAWQFEAKAYPTTYADGDMIGFNDVRPYASYFWTGVPHHSTSVRRETTGSGGRIVSWSERVKFLTTSIIGLGMTTVEPWLQALANGQEVHRGSRLRPRDFTITGKIFANRFRSLLSQHNDLIDLIKPNNTLGSEQFILRYQQVDSAERLVGAPMEIVCTYTDGLKGNSTNFYQENIALQFRASQPFPMDIIESSAELQLFKQLIENSIIFKDETGDYINLGSGSTTATPTAVGFLRNGSPVVFGPFSQVAGDTASKAAYWNGTDWVQMGVLGGDAVDVDDGYTSGYPLTVATTVGNVREYDADADSWTTVGGTGFLGALHALTRDIDGNIWAAGDFEFADDGVTSFNNVAKWDVVTEEWEPVGFGLTDPSDLGPLLRALTVLNTDDGNIYFGGWFQQGESDAATTFAINAIRWDIAEQQYHAMGQGLNAAPNQFIKGRDGYIYAVGEFSESGTGAVPLRGFARYNGYSWEEVFPLVRVDGALGADGVTLDEEGVFWFFAYTSSADDMFAVPGLGAQGTFGWKDGVFYPGIGSVSVADMAIGPGNRTLYAVRDVESRPHYRVPALNLIDYGGSADTPLAVHIEGPVHPSQILNLSTKGGVFFRGDFDLGYYENMTIRTDTQKSLVYSNARANLFKEVLAGPSSTLALRLRPGINRLSVYCNRETFGDTLGWVSWRNRYMSIAGAND